MVKPKQQPESSPIKATISYETGIIKVWVPVSEERRTHGTEVKALSLLKAAQLPHVAASYTGTTRGRVGTRQCRVFLYKIEKG
jgi:hypothetical protein